jgi:hypothetical protein
MRSQKSLKKDWLCRVGRGDGNGNYCFRFLLRRDHRWVEKADSVFFGNLENLCPELVVAYALAQMLRFLFVFEL